MAPAATIAVVVKETVTTFAAAVLLTVPMPVVVVVQAVAEPTKPVGYVKTTVVAPMGNAVVVVRVHVNDVVAAPWAPPVATVVDVAIATDAGAV